MYWDIENKDKSQNTPCPCHSAIPLCFACSLLGVGRPDFCWDRVVGWCVKASWPFKLRVERTLFHFNSLSLSLCLEHCVSNVSLGLCYINIHQVAAIHFRIAAVNTREISTAKEAMLGMSVPNIMRELSTTAPSNLVPKGKGSLQNRLREKIGNGTVSKSCSGSMGIEMQPYSTGGCVHSCWISDQGHFWL